MPSAVPPGADDVDTRYPRYCSGVLSAQRVGASLSIVRFDVHLHRAVDDLNNNDNTIETSRVDHLDGSSPFLATRSEAGWRRHQRNSKPGLVQLAKGVPFQTNLSETRSDNRSCICRRTRQGQALSEEKGQA